jgi:hypothetical protein
MLFTASVYSCVRVFGPFPHSIGCPIRCQSPGQTWDLLHKSNRRPRELPAQLVQEFTTRITPSLAAELERNPEITRNYYPNLIRYHQAIACVRAFKSYPESKYLPLIFRLDASVTTTTHAPTASTDDILDSLYKLCIT